MAAPAPGGSESSRERGVAPVVALPRPGVSWIVIAIGMAVFAIMLFNLLDARRQAAQVASVRPGRGDNPIGTAEPPPLRLPPAPTELPPRVETPQPMPQPVEMSRPAPPPEVVYVPQPAAATPAQLVERPPRINTDNPLVYDGGGAPSVPSGSEGGSKESSRSGVAAGALDPSVAGARTRAGMFSNRAMTVPQGTLIPAVLETGLDSTSAGLARALVSRDVRGFDGTNILIPRGSRLIGEYAAGAQAGQKRAMVNWIRLIRPDGVTIAVGSPASDPVGRGGIAAKVNSHFWQRFTGAILQSSLDLGVNLASDAAGAPVLVLPGTLASTGRGTIGDQVTPTLSVKPGTSISVFVARDLDFAGVEVPK